MITAEDAYPPASPMRSGALLTKERLRRTIALTSAALLAAGSFGDVGCGRIDTIVGAVGEIAPGLDGSIDASAPGAPDGGAIAPPDATCPSPFYIDVASARLAGGFTLQSDPSAPNGEYLSPPDVSSRNEPGDASATYSFDVGCAGDYLVWGRIHGPGVDANSFWFQVDDGAFYVWRLSTGVSWYWKAATSGTDYGTPLRFAFDGGTHTLVFRNGTPSVGLAGLYVAPPGEPSPPGNDTPCDPPNSIELTDGGCELSCGSAGGNACSTIECAGRPTFLVYDCSDCCYVPPGSDGGDADGGAREGRDATSD